MAEKNFKITGGLALGDYALTANGLSLLWDGNAIASEAYVDSALAGATVNTNAIAASLASSTLYVDSGDNLNVNVNAFVDTIDGSGLYVSGNVLVVNVNAFVDTIDGSGLYVSNNQLAVNTNVIATKDYVDSVAQGLDVKASVKVATTESLSPQIFFTGVENSTQIDGISLSNGNRVLVKNQTSTDQNGIYVVSDDGTYITLARAADANDPTVDLTTGAFTFVEEGTVNAGKGFVAAVPTATMITWTQFSEAGSLTSGVGIYISSGSINVNTNAIAEKGYVDTKVNTMFNLTGSGLYSTGSGSTLAVNTNAVASALSSSTLYVSDGDNLNVNVNAFVDTLDGSGLYVSNNQLAANTMVLATRSYVDSVAQGLDVKASVIVASTGPVDIGAAPATIDGVTLAVGDRVLLKNQTDASQNGIYEYPGEYGNLVIRTSDADTDAKITKGAFTFVEQGSTNAGKGFVVTAIGELDLDPMTWAQFSEAGSLTAGTGIAISSGTISVNTNAVASALSSSTLYVDSGDNLNVNVNAFVDTIDGSGLYVSGNVLVVNVNTLTGTGLVNNGSSLSLDQYAAGVRYDGTSGSTGGTSVTTDTIYAAQSSVNTYVTVGTIGMNKAFTLDVWMKVPDSATNRKSTVSGITDGYGNVEYTEYAIVDSGTAVLFPDVFVEFDAGVYNIKCKSGESTMKFIIESKVFSL